MTHHTISENNATTKSKGSNLLFFRRFKSSGSCCSVVMAACLLLLFSRSAAANTIDFSYQYDSSGRLVRADGNGKSIFYTYDSAGNRTRLKIQGKPGITVTPSNDGTVISSPAGINCGPGATDCSALFDMGAQVTLKAVPAVNHIQTGWTGGGCSAAGPCAITLTADVTVSPIFSINTTTLDSALDNPHLSWTTGGTGMSLWYAQSTVAYTGNNAAQSGTVSDGQNSWMESTIVGPAVLSFSWKVSSEENHDFLNFFLDSNLHDRISGEKAGRRVLVNIPAGVHVIRWEYAKDASGSSGLDAGWVDKVEVCYGGTYQVTPALKVSTSAGGADTVTVTGPACPFTWTAESNVPWIAVTTGASGSGNGAVAFTVASGTETAGTLSIAGRTVTVVRPGAGLDPSFNPSGSSPGIRLYNGTSAGGNSGNAIITEDAGKMVVAGVTANAVGGTDIIVYRLNGDGAPDTTFGSGGLVTWHNPNGGNSMARGIVRGIWQTFDIDGDWWTSNQGYAVVGTTSNGSNTDILVLMMDLGGNLAAGFGTGGAFTWNGGGNDSGNGIVMKDDFLKVVGTSHNGTDDDIVVLSIDNKGGALDNTFGTGGVFSWNGGGADAGNAIILDGDKFVVAGATFNGAKNDLAVMRLTAAGALDPSFGVNGVFLWENGGSDAGQGIAFDGSRYVIAGTTFNGSDTDIAVLGLLRSGVPDMTFGKAGLFTWDGGGNDAGKGIVFNGQNYFIAGAAASGGNNDIVVLSLNRDGILNGTFGINGVSRWGGARNDGANGVTATADGGAIVTGEYGRNESGLADIFAARGEAEFRRIETERRSN